MDRSLRRLGQLLVVMGALLGAVLGVALALIVEHAETSRAVAALGRERAAVLAASPPSSNPQPPERRVPRIRRMAAIPPAISALSRPAVATSVLVRPTRTARAAGTRPAAVARTNPTRAKATTSRERLRCQLR